MEEITHNNFISNKDLLEYMEKSKREIIQEIEFSHGFTWILMLFIIVIFLIH